MVGTSDILSHTQCITTMVCLRFQLSHLEFYNKCHEVPVKIEGKDI